MVIIYIIKIKDKIWEFFSSQILKIRTFIMALITKGETKVGPEAMAIKKTSADLGVDVQKLLEQNVFYQQCLQIAQNRILELEASSINTEANLTIENQKLKELLTKQAQVQQEQQTQQTQIKGDDF
jgi:hypothetical protein